MSRSKKITALLDNNLKMMSSGKTEVNLSKLVNAFSRSRNNKELYQLVDRAILGMAEFVYQRSRRQNPSAQDLGLLVYIDYVVNNWGHMKYEERRGMPHFENCDAQERRRLNPIIHQALYDRMGTNRFSFRTPPGFPRYEE